MVTLYTLAMNLVICLESNPVSGMTPSSQPLVVDSDRQILVESDMGKEHVRTSEQLVHEPPYDGQGSQACYTMIIITIHIPLY